MAVSSLGVGSGLDLNGILTSLMQVEQQPLLAMQKKEASYQARISALGSLKGALSSLQTAAQGFIPATGQTAADKYASFKASLADSAIGTATASTGAVAGSYSLEVTALAKAQRLTGVGNGVEPIQAIQREQPDVPDFVLGEDLRARLEVDGVFNRPIILKLWRDQVRIDGQQLHHVAECHYLVGKEIASEAKANDQQLPKLLGSHKAIGGHCQHRK